jgi:enterochelin esterase-like enzyme
VPRVFLAAGELELFFAARTSTAYRELRAAGADAAFESYLSGHDELMWRVALVHYMPEVFPPGK